MAKSIDARLKAIGAEASGAYQGYLDGYPNGWIHNFKTNERVKFKYAMTTSYQTSTKAQYDYEYNKQ